MNDGTLFVGPGWTQGGGGGGRRGGGGRGALERRRRDSSHAEGPLLRGLALGEAAQGLTTVMLLLGIAATIIAAILAPALLRERGGDSGRAHADHPGRPGILATGDERKDIAKEFEGADHVARQHRVDREGDRAGRALGRHAPAAPPDAGQGEHQSWAAQDDRRAETNALIQTIEAKLKINIDATTVHIAVEWSQPEAARDIVQAR